MKHRPVQVDGLDIFYREAGDRFSIYIQDYGAPIGLRLAQRNPDRVQTIITQSGKPPVLIVWGKNDEIFGLAGAEAYLKDLPDAELNLLDTGHFALEEDGDLIAQKIRTFLGRHIR